MKRNCIFKMAIVAIAVMVSLGAYAQEESKMAAGADVGVLLRDGATNFSIGAKFQYDVTKVIRGSGEFNYFLDGGGFWDLNVNGHYLIDLPTPKLKVYPLAGLSVVGFGGGGLVEYYDPIEEIWVVEEAGGGSSTFIGFNLGGGVQYELKSNILLQGELKYRIGNGAIAGVGLSVGVAYKF
ncbi:MAG: hypothetical protein LBE91_16470 [Tannerella sp.]|jgi:opacity protein-like surface antigen|nr:hypothetical protein [Tannerella sp.]